MLKPTGIADMLLDWKKIQNHFENLKTQLDEIQHKQVPSDVSSA